MGILRCAVGERDGDPIERTGPGTRFEGQRGRARAGGGASGEAAGPPAAIAVSTAAQSATVRAIGPA